MANTTYPYVLGIVAAVVMFLFIAALLRRGVLPERFAAFWLLVSMSVVVMAVFPQIVTKASQLLGVQIPANLLFFLTAVVLLLVSVQLSYEVSRVQARTRRLAEEVALLQQAVDRLERDRPTPGDGEEWSAQQDR